MREKEKGEKRWIRKPHAGNLMGLDHPPFGIGLTSPGENGVIV